MLRNRRRVKVGEKKKSGKWRLSQAPVTSDHLYSLHVPSFKGRSGKL